MKRIVIVIVSLLTAVVVTAQTGNDWHLTFGAELGVTNYFNYPRLSLNGGVERSYTAPTASFSLGLRDSNMSVGLRYSLTDIRTGMGDENVAMNDISIMVQRSTMIAPRLELFGGVAIGFALQQNRFSHNGDYLSATHYGISAAFEAGVRYYLSDNVFLFAKAGIGSTMMFDHNLGLPPDIDVSQHRGITYAMESTTVGFGIGFNPRVKKINMPSVLIDHDNRYLLASYN